MLPTSVTCLLCGHQAQTLARHLKSAHNITADAYRKQYPEARIRSEACEANRRAAITNSHAEKPRVGLKRTVTCPCGAVHEVPLTYASKDFRCPTCKVKDEDAKWVSKVEGRDYVTCLGCGHRAENLTSHVQNVHPEWVRRYPGQMVALDSSIRDKSALKGRAHSEETKAKMSENAGRWNAGLTKETDDRVASAASKMVGRSSWSKGLTKEDHPSLQSTSEKLSTWRGDRRHWSNGFKADLSEVDFTPYLDETGAVDRKVMAEDLGLSEVTVTKYMESLGLRLSTKYVDARVERDVEAGRFYEMSKRSAEASTIRLTEEQLKPYRLGVSHEGKLVVARAMSGLGHAYAVIKRECVRLGVPTYEHLVKQTLCLDAVSRALDGATYEQEWRSRQFMTEAGNFYRFDGFFPSHNLVVEFHGYQHWTFPSVYIKREELYFALQERDRIKENLIHGDPTLRYFLVREDEPYADSAHIRGRLIDEGVLDPGK